MSDTSYCVTLGFSSLFMLKFRKLSFMGSLKFTLSAKPTKTSLNKDVVRD